MARVRRDPHNPDHNRANVWGETSSEYDHYGTLTLRAWLRYWKAVRNGRQAPNPGDTVAEAAHEVGKLSREIRKRGFVP